MSSRTRNVITGVVVLGALCLFAWMLMQFTGRATGALATRGIPVTIVAPRADGVSDGSIIEYRGVKVGKVMKVNRSDDNLHVLIEAELERTPPLPGNLKAVVRIQSMIGMNAILELDTTGAPAGAVAPGQQIPGTYLGTQLLPPEFSEILTDVRRQKLIEHTDAAIVSLHEQLDRAGKVLTSVQDLVGDPKIQSDIRDTVANMKSVTQRADRIGGNLEKFTTDLHNISNNANDTIAEMHKTIQRTGGDVDDLARHLTDDIDKMGKVLDQFQQVAAKINSGHGTAGQLLNDPVLYDQLTDTARELNLVAKSIHRLIDQWEQEGLSLKVK